MEKNFFACAPTSSVRTFNAPDDREVLQILSSTTTTSLCTLDVAIPVRRIMTQILPPYISALMLKMTLFIFIRTPAGNTALAIHVGGRDTDLRAKIKTKMVVEIVENF